MVVAETHRVDVGGGLATTVHVLRLARSDYTARVVALDPVQPLVGWCAANRVDHALIGGFYTRADGTPLGDLHIDGTTLPSVPFDAPWNRVRACVHIDGDVRLCSRLEVEEKLGGDLIQAGPMLARGGTCVIDPEADAEGFSAGARQFDSDITIGRHPRAAFGISETELIAAVCDGRTETEAGLELQEMAHAMLDLGAEDAINLDGGGSASLVVHGQLINVPYAEPGMPISGGRSVPTALRFGRR